MTVTKRPHFHDLPPEVVENIAENLDLGSLKCLRLASTACRILCLGPRFKSFFRQKTTDLTESSLEALCALASHPDLGPAVKHLTIMAVIYDVSEAERILSLGVRRIAGKLDEGTVRSAVHATLAQENNLTFGTLRGFKNSRPMIGFSRQNCDDQDRLDAESDLTWLRARQKEQDGQSDESILSSLVSAFRTFTRLDSVNLDAITVWGRRDTTVSTLHGQDWHRIWVRASQVYRLSMSALATSGLVVESLAVYRNTLRCSVPSCDIMAPLENFDSRNIALLGTSIRNLALGVSMKVETDAGKISATRKKILEQTTPGSRRLFDWDMLGSTDPEAVAETNFTGIARLLQFMPNLEALDLHLYRCLRGDLSGYDQIFELISQHIRLPLLKQCYLRGVYATQGALLQFLANHPFINHLDLREIYLTSGAWEPVIDHLNSKMPTLTRLRLSNLWTTQVLNLRPIWEADFDEMDYLKPSPISYPCQGGLVVHTWDFKEHDLKKGLEFYPTVQNPIPLGSPGRLHWLQSCLLEYGPPMGIIP
ncbi:hypothetical protein GX51_05860 [Blastomyces parvus]|uniref:F-box domain-containing protein n=1 Tax=Blastomyces parvus TaxID=2060905 RepID=A0A2B7WV35_9EURO|nr:hypothetical protein GX51_05860 [Blastomyces parvus]